MDVLFSAHTLCNVSMETRNLIKSTTAVGQKTQDKLNTEHCVCKVVHFIPNGSTKWY